jgi:membrane carboxypeptidase/penicillin-binding protein PbpC
MKKYILIIALLALASACGTNSGTPATNGGTSNPNSPANTNTATAPNNANATAANTTKTSKNTSPKSDEPYERTGGERVKIASGENSAHLTRNIPANGSIDFLINVKKGQKMGMQLSYEGKASDIEGFLSEPGLQDTELTLKAEERKEFDVKTNGDHRLTVVNQTGKKITFTLYTDIY